MWKIAVEMVVFYCIVSAVSFRSELHGSANIMSVQSPGLSRQTENEVDGTERFVKKLSFISSCSWF